MKWTIIVCGEKYVVLSLSRLLLEVILPICHIRSSKNYYQMLCTYIIYDCVRHNLLNRELNDHRGFSEFTKRDVPGRIDQFKNSPSYSFIKVWGYVSHVISVYIFPILTIQNTEN